MIKIDESKCVGCGNCVEVCPFGTLKIRAGKATVEHPDNCRECGACINACPNGAISKR